MATEGCMFGVWPPSLFYYLSPWLTRFSSLFYYSPSWLTKSRQICYLALGCISSCQLWQSRCILNVTRCDTWSSNFMFWIYLSEHLLFVCVADTICIFLDFLRLSFCFFFFFLTALCWLHPHTDWSSILCVCLILFSLVIICHCIYFYI